MLDVSTRRRIAKRFSTTGHRMHARWKLAYDPAYVAARELLHGSQLPVLDIGCGLGLLAHVLQATEELTRYIGVDHDARKIDAGRDALARAGLPQDIELHHADAASLPPHDGHVVLLDILHYLPRERQQDLLDTALMHLADEGLLIIRNVLREPNWRFHATRLEEFFLQRSGWIPTGAQHYPSAEEIRRPLERHGLTVNIRALHGRTPYNSYLIVARR
ncbi:class I SAM-dependent methyltransferase [Dyella sp.]|uniref:class I SAM-dependent methyltransferase n=1 Tax=Dyella sp. TaxID=1869338 RepID=UPI002ED1923A